MNLNPTNRCLLIPVLSLFANFSAVAGQSPVQTYFIPLPEYELLHDGFRKISTIARGPVNSFTSIAIAASKTVIWYDHWEDGYDFQVTKPSQETTEIWGDGNCDNGFAPNINGVPRTCNSPSDDYLEAGNAITLDNDVPLPRDSSVFLFDGRDKIQSSFPIAMTRGAFPRRPGSFLAGAVEVVNTESWGTHYVTPVGRDTTSGTEAFEWSALFVMAHKEGTVVTLPDGNTELLRQGQNLSIQRVNEGDEITSTEPVQVVLVAGDRRSAFELRWYTLTPRTEWSTEYYTPVGTGVNALTGAWLYNPGPSTIDITYTFKGGVTGTISGIEPNDAVLSPTIPDGSGARFTSTDAFYGITQTETGPSGDNFDWGHPLIPMKQLTSQALVGWGYGCTDNQCVREGIEYSVSRSVVFVTPVTDAVIKVDFDNDGVVDEFHSVEAMESVKLVSSDDDMTGALVFATTADELEEPVKIAVSWGQDPARSGMGDSGALDLGTSVPPLPLLDAGKSTVLLDDVDGNGAITPGDVLQYTIRVANIGQVALPAGAFNVIDFGLPLFDSATYKEGSTSYCTFDQDNQLLQQVMIDDDVVGSAFPLDGNGLASIGVIEARGGSHEVKFEAVIRPVEELPAGSFSVSNTGVITTPDSDEPIDKFNDSTNYVIFPTPTLEVCGEGDGCGPLLSASGPAGTYCAEQRGDNLEVTVTATEPGCELWETHLCNLPYLSDEQLNTPTHTLVIPSDEAYAFACGFGEDTFVVAGHATISCDDGTGVGEIRKNSYFEVELCCEEIYPPGFEPPPGHSGPWGGPGTDDGGDATAAPAVAPTNAPVKACDYECPDRALPVDEGVCPESFADCVCKNGYKMNNAGDQCINDCQAFECPPNSTPKRANCVRFMRDCVCDAGFTSINNQCLVPS